MSVRVMARVWEQSTHAGTELLMLLAIADFADDNGNAYPAVATLAAKCRMSARNANFILTALRASGELEIRTNEGPRGTNLYRVVTGMKSASPPLKSASPPDPEAGFTPEEPFTLKPTSSPPEAGFLQPLKPTSDEPSLNHHESPEKEREKPAKRKSRISPDWEPSKELRAWTIAKRSDLQIDQVAESFRDYHLAKDELRADWDASWRNWVKREGTFDAPRREASGETPYQRNMREKMERWAPSIAAKAPGAARYQPADEFFEVEAREVARRQTQISDARPRAPKSRHTGFDDCDYKGPPDGSIPS